MKIEKITLNNFQGVRYFEARFDGRNADVLGDNATGKTTLLNAHTWLLFGRAGDGQPNYTPQTTDEDGGLTHNLDHSVEETLIQDDGSHITLKKVYHEVYKKQRGSQAEQLAGRTVDHYINGVPVKEAEYTERVADFCGGDIEQGKILTLPDYFAAELPWQKRRAYLLELCGDISDDAVIQSCDKLADLPAVIVEYGGGAKISVDELKAIVKSRMTKVNDELKRIPARIDEAERAMPDIPDGITREQAQQAVTDAHAALDKASRELTAANDPSVALAEARARAAEARTRFMDSQREYSTWVSNGMREHDKSIRDGLYSAQSELRNVQDEIAENERKFNAAIQLREKLTAEYKEVWALKWDESRENCPTCGQALPAERIAEMREEFNANRAKRLEEINKRGKAECSKEYIDSLQCKLSQLIERKTEIQARIKDIEAQPALELPNFNETEPGAKVTKELDDALNEVRRLEDEAAMARRDIEPKLQAYKDKLSEAQRILANIDTAERQQARIAELEAEQQKLNAEYENLDRALWLCEEFVREKVALLTDSINSKFDAVRFRLFVQQVNGGLREDCEVLIPSPDGNLVPYTTANNGAKINAGLQIIDALSRHWGVYMPVIIDNAESITRLQQIPAQTIALRVSENHKTLKVDIGG